MPELKSFLIQQAQLPVSIEASLPQGMPKLSSMLTQFAANLPKTPDLPIPGSNGGSGGAAFGAFGTFPDVANVIKGIEEPLPDMFPRFSQGLSALGGSPYRPIEEEAASKPTVKQPTMGGGYRRITK